MNGQPAYNRGDTNRGGCDVIEHDAHSATRGLSEARVTGAELFDQVSIVAKHCGGILRIRIRRDRVSLGITVIRPNG